MRRHRAFLPAFLSSTRHGCVAATAGLFLSLPAVAPAATAAKPNIVYILADDLGYGDVQALNPARGKIRTPHLDRLAAQGMTFTDAHSGSAVCTPTRYGLLTGRYAWRTHLQRGVYDGTDDPPLIADGRLTVPALLRQHGYVTAAIGKWHLGFLSERPSSAAAPAANSVSATAKKINPSRATPACPSARASSAARSRAASTISGAAPTPARCPA